MAFCLGAEMLRAHHLRREYANPRRDREREYPREKAKENKILLFRARVNANHFGEDNSELMAKVGA